MISPQEEWHVEFPNANVGGVTGTRGVFSDLPSAQAWVAQNQPQAGQCTVYRVTRDPWVIYTAPPAAPAGSAVPSPAVNVTHTKFGS